MINRKHKIIKNLLLHILIFALLLSFSLPALSEGSISMVTPKDNPLAFRPYIFWDETSNNKTLDILRQQKIKVYAKNKGRRKRGKANSYAYSSRYIYSYRKR